MDPRACCALNGKSWVGGGGAPLTGGRTGHLPDRLGRSSPCDDCALARGNSRQGARIRPKLTQPKSRASFAESLKGNLAHQ